MLNRFLFKAALIPVLFGLLGFHSRRTGGNVDVDVDVDADSSSRPRRTRSALDGESHARDAAETRSRIEQARAMPKNSGPERDALNQQHPTRSYDEDLPAGWYRDTNGRVHNDEGEFAPDPNITDREHNRETEYPSNFSQATHDRMAREYTDQGRDLDAGRPASITRGDPPTTVPLSMDSRGAIVDPSGTRVPRSELTWRDDSRANNGLGNEISYYDERGNTNLTYEHKKSVVEHWVTEGYKQKYSARQDWYNGVDNPGNLVPMDRPKNSHGGATLPWSYSDAAPDRASGYTSKYD